MGFVINSFLSGGASVNPALWMSLQPETLGAAGTDVATWDDSAPTGTRDATQATSGDRPAVVANAWGAFKGVKQNGTANSLVLPSMTGLTQATLFMVLASFRDDGVAQGDPFYVGAGGFGHYPYSDGNIYWGNMWASRPSVGNPTKNLTEYHILCVRSGVNRREFRINNSVLFNSTAAHTPSFTGTPYLFFPPGHSFDWAGTIVQCDVYDSVFTDGEIDALYAEYLTKFGAPVITSNGGGPTAEYIAVNGDTGTFTTITSKTINDATVVYGKTGADAALFSINTSTGVLTWVSPASTGTYSVTVTATANGQTSNQIINIEVTTFTAAAPTHGAHTDWRMTFSGGGVCSIGELELWASGVKIDLTGTTISVSGTGEGAAANMFDGNPSNYWYSGGGGAGWVEIRFPSATAVDMVMVQGRGPGVQCPSNMLVEYGDSGGSRTTAWSVTGDGVSTWANRRWFFPDPAAGYKFYQMQFPSDPSFATRIAELKWCVNAGGENQLLEAFEGNVSSTAAGTYANLIDGNPATEWASNPVCYITAFFADDRPINEIYIQAGTLPGQAPDLFNFRRSDDGFTWITQDTITGLEWFFVGEVKTIDVAAPAGVIISSNGGGDTADIDVYGGTLATTVVAFDWGGDVTYSIVGGADAADFSIDSDTGVLTFNTAPTPPATFEVIVRATGPSGFDEQTLNIEAISLTPVKFNSADMGPGLTLINSDRTVYQPTGLSAWRSVRTDIPINAGDSFYFEVNADDISGHSQGIMWGVSTLSAAILSNFTGAVAGSVGWQINVGFWGTWSTAGSTPGISGGDRIGFVIVRSSAKVWYRKVTGGVIGAWHSGDPELGTGGATITDATLLAAADWYFAVSTYTSNDRTSLKLPSDFLGPIPSGSLPYGV